MTKTARLMGCVAAAWLFGVGASNATVITLIGTGGAASVSGALSGPQDLIGSALKATALVYTTDFVEFSVVPDSPASSVVNVLNDPASGNPSFPNEMFRIVRDTAGGAIVLAATAASNNPVTVSLLTGVNYFLEFNSDTPPTGRGASTFGVHVPQAPLPGALFLFGTVFGAGGLLMRRRRKGSDLGAAA